MISFLKEIEGKKYGLITFPGLTKLMSENKCVCDMYEIIWAMLKRENTIIKNGWYCEYCHGDKL